MARRMTSPTLVGRSAELESLRAATAAAAAGQGRIVLIGGDAGIGKTRLVTEFCALARADGFRTAVGGCVQLGDVAIAYAPMVEALREIGRELGSEAFAELAGHGRDDLDGLGAGRGAEASSGPGPLFEHLRALLSRLGEQQPIVLVLEDMHWADASTRALIAYLGRNLRDTRVVLVLTYRSDELHRRHPLRPLLTDLERDPLVERIRLAGLSRAELVELLTGIGEVSPEVDELLSRTEGNPFYVEEIVAAGAGILPDTLAEVVLSRVGRLSEPTQALLHRAAVLGDEVDERLLAALTGDSADAVTGALREAVFEQLLVVDAEGCRFRHALIREALYDDLLPGERERLHVAAAHAVEDPAVADRLDEHVRWAMLAHHWHAAREPERAFAASVRAGLEAERVRAHADAAAHYERALQLWDRIPDPVAAAAMNRTELFDHAAKAVHWSSHSTRATTLAKAALDALEPDTPPETRAVQLVRLGRMHWIAYDGQAAITAYDQAVALLADRPPSAEQAYTLAAQGQSLMLRGMSRAAEPVLRKAYEVASAVGPGVIRSGAVAGHALCSLGPVLADLGRVDEAIATMERARELALEDASPSDVSRCYTNHTHVLLLAARWADLDSLATEGMAYTEATGHLRHYGESIIGIWCLGLYAAGRSAEAEERVTGLVDRVTAEDPYLVLRWLPLLIGQGRFDQARSLVDYSIKTTAGADDIQFTGLARFRAAALARAEQRLDEAREHVTAGLATITPDEQYYGLPGYALALGIEADLRTADRADALLAAAQQLAERLRSLGITLLPEPRAALVLAEAEHARAHGTDTPDRWVSVASAWEQAGQPYQAAIARYREADAILRTRGDRARAASCAASALSVAEELGAEPFTEQVRLLVQRGRLDLPVADDHKPDPLARLGVTPREADVLALLAAGLTNRQIGESLFISEKTASVHVTNLLRKLSVGSRLEAAEIAQSLGLS